MFSCSLDVYDSQAHAEATQIRATHLFRRASRKTSSSSRLPMIYWNLSVAIDLARFYLHSSEEQEALHFYMEI